MLASIRHMAGSEWFELANLNGAWNEAWMHEAAMQALRRWSAHVGPSYLAPVELLMCPGTVQKHHDAACFAVLHLLLHTSQDGAAA